MPQYYIYRGCAALMVKVTDAKQGGAGTFRCDKRAASVKVSLVIDHVDANETKREFPDTRGGCPGRRTR